jgi:transglutaminase-like putative cysteine protease
LIYSVRHVTKFRYKPEVRESMMELRMQPLSDERQRCLSFSLDVRPAAALMQYRDAHGNVVHHFNIAGGHSELSVKADALVEVTSGSATETSGSWSDLNALVAREDHWEMLLPSTFARPTPTLEELAKEIDLERSRTPFEVVHKIMRGIHEKFSYVPNSTAVDSPIDHALSERKGVCQDFAHIMIALVRSVDIPCRYVSGYLFHSNGDQGSAEGASHAWVEALLPGSGWTEFDPTNNVMSGERHIRVAIGRDYADVPPTRGVFKGGAESELSVSVAVALADAPAPQDLAPTMVIRRVATPVQHPYLLRQEQEQQQQ